MPQTPPPQKPSFEERLTDAAIKLIVAGSGGYALYNLYVDDLPKAAIAGAISIVSTLLTKFGEGLTGVLGDRMKERGVATGQAVNEVVDEALGQALPRLTDFHKQYLDALQTHCHNLKVEGYKGRLPRLVLEKVYVPLRVHQSSQGYGRLQGSLKIWDLLPKVHHDRHTFPERLLAVIADPGYGKTTLMRFLTLTFSNRTHVEHDTKELLPILLLFREFYPRIQSRTEPSLSELIVESVQKLPRCGDLRTSKPWFESQLEQGKCLVMLDGLDEVPEAQRDLASQWANWQMQNYESQFIITSRPHGYDSSLFEGVQRIDILDFNNDQKRAFIEQWYRFITWEFTWKRHFDDSQHDPDANKRLSREQVEAESNAEADTAAADLSRQLFADQTMTDLAKNPLLITIIAATHEASENLPKRRVNLYREIFKLLLEYRPNRRDTRLTLTSAEENQAVLQTLALKLTEAEKTQFSPTEGRDWIKAKLAEISSEDTLPPQQFLREIQQVSGLLAGGEGNLYEFTHKTFQEYLAAVELSQHPAWGPETALKQFTNENWREVVYFFALLTDPQPFLEAALNNTDNAYTLKLAQDIANAGPRIRGEIKEQLLAARRQQEPKSATVTLEQKFRSMTSIHAKTAISDYITWGEYSQFLEAQAQGQFHSWAKTLSESAKPIRPSSRLLSSIPWEDARWFCAWLSTQPTLLPDDGVYHYRLPTPEELTTLASLSKVSPQAHAHEILGDIKTSNPQIQPWTTDSTQPGNVLRVVREHIPDRYANLVNYLASGSWKEADQETYKLMLSISGEEAEKRQYLKIEEIKNFSCEDLLIMDQLWVKFSGGKFGFSIQKKLWVEVGGKLDFGEDYKSAQTAFKKMSDRNGWSNIGYDINKVTYDTSAPNSHLPFALRGVGGVLFSRIASCEL